MVTKQKLASNPSFSAAVIASAGSGKTWTLVSRLLRLLLQGSDSRNILAITFTVRAAAEMRQRLLERLENWSKCDEPQLIASLEEIGHPTDRQSLLAARTLFEKQLNAKTPVRTLTFHAFFQEILSQLAVEAGVPSGFELTENTFDHEEIALELLLNQAHEDRNSAVAKALMVLLEKLGYAGTRNALKTFIKQRSDWWAWTEDINKAEDRIAFAQQQLAARQEVDFDTDHIQALFNDAFIEKLQRYADFYICDDFPKQVKIRAAETATLIKARSKKEPLQSYEQLKKILPKKDGQPYAAPGNAKVRKLFGEDRLEIEYQNYREICQQLAEVAEQLKRQDNHQINCAWYHVGEHYLEHFQKQKRQRRQLDFSDLEWKAYQLLSNADDFSLVRNKLDDSVEHLLIDEFQDTNPTQWQFVMPLLKDFAATIENRNNLFIVGDSKQSIYGFRRANPELLDTAADWIAENVGAKVFNENDSYRSSVAIMDAVNKIFSEHGYLGAIGDYYAHGTHRNELWGRVEIWPEFRLPVEEKNNVETNEEVVFRNPLLNALADKETAYHLEAEAIAEKIEELVASRLEITDDNNQGRAITYSDIQILVRKRTHVGKIERKLQARRIPFRASTRGSYMEQIEIKDLCALLKTIVTPADDLSLAHVLRSPVFSINNAELMLIANTAGDSWHDRIQAIAASESETKESNTSKISRAAKLLQQWQKLATILPLHDLITKIFYQGNIINRYTAAFPAWQKSQLNANLERFVELALEINSGRYPGVHHFLQHLQLQASANDNEAISEPTPTESNNAINILTIHEAKGLEAPVVFAANCNEIAKSNTSGNAVVDWPPSDPKPRLIALQTAAEKRDKLMTELHEKQQQKEKREAANLLYVALTRAKQLLIVSASEAKKGSDPNKKNPDKNIVDIDVIRKALSQNAEFDDDEIVYLETSKPKTAKTIGPAMVPEITTELSAKLNGKLSLSAFDTEIAPSRIDNEVDTQHGKIDGRLRGTAIHQILHRLISDATPSDRAILSQIAATNSIETSDSRLIEWLAEAKKSVQAFPELMINRDDALCYTELPVVFKSENNRVFGVIDRIIIEQETITIIDFKTHRHNQEQQATLAKSFRTQLGYYEQAAALLWPNRSIKTGILFTENNKLIWLKK